MSDDLKQELADLLRTAQPAEALSPECHGALADRIATKHVRLVSRRRRWTISTVGTAVVLFALGFVPFPAGSAKGAVAKAMVAAENVVTLHFIRQSTHEKGNKYLSETWADDQGFYRRDDIENGKLTWTILTRGTSSVIFYAPKLHATESFNPHAVYRQEHHEISPMLECWKKQPFFDRLRNSHYYDDVKIKEYKKRTLWGGTVIIADMKAVIHPRKINGKPYAGQTATYRLEIDPATDRIFKENERWIAGDKHRQAETIYEWEVPIPDSAREFTPPAGTKLTRNLWWQDKVDKVVAQASTPDGEVILHDVQVDNKGNIIASIYTRNTAVLHRIVVEDNVGNRYYSGSSMGISAEFPHCYAVIPITKAAGGSAEIPTTATFTFQPHQKGASKDKVAVLKDVPLPARQPLSTEDLMRKDSEVVQY